AIVLVVPLARAPSERASSRFLRSRLRAFAPLLERADQRGSRARRPCARRHAAFARSAAIRSHRVLHRLVLLPLPQTRASGSGVGPGALALALRPPHGSQPALELVRDAPLVRPRFGDSRG